MACSWCVVELFVHLIIGTDRRRSVDVLRLPGVESYAEFKSFDARQAQCAYSQDRQLLLTVIEAFPGGISAFNGAVVRSLAEQFESWRTSSGASERHVVVDVDPLGQDDLLDPAVATAPSEDLTSTELLAATAAITGRAAANGDDSDHAGNPSAVIDDVETGPSASARSGAARSGAPAERAEWRRITRSV